MTQDLAKGSESSLDHKRVTYSDIARATGVSKATVSYVLNETPNRRISAPTRELILETATRLGHVPYAPARALSSGTSNLILMLVPGYTIGQLFGTGLQQLDDSLAQQGRALLVHHHSGRGRSLRDLWSLVAPSGVVAVGGEATSAVREITGSSIPVFDLLSAIDNVAIGRMQAEYLVGKGHRSLGFAMPDDPSIELFSAQRLRGVRAVCHQFNLEPPMVLRVNDRPEDIDELVDIWLAGDRPTTAVCAHNDETALLLMAAFSRRNIDVPKVIAIIGVDDIPLARNGLTTIAVSNVDLWSTIAAVVSGQVNDESKLPAPASYLALVERASA